MGTGPKGQMQVRLAAHVETVGIRKGGRIAVGTGIKQAKGRSLWPILPADRQILGCVAVKEDQRRRKAEHFLNRRRHQAGVRPQPGHLVGVGHQRVQPAAHHVDRRSMACVQDLHHRGDQFVMGQQARALGLGHRAYQVVAGPGLAGGIKVLQRVMEQPHCRLGPLLAVWRAAADIEIADGVVRPLRHLRGKRGVGADQVADHLSRQMGRQIGDKIKAALREQAVKRGIDPLRDKGPQAFQPGLGKEWKHRAPQPVMVRPVQFQH